jgi:hypothetical protein
VLLRLPAGECGGSVSRDDAFALWVHDAWTGQCTMLDR